MATNNPNSAANKVGTSGASNSPREEVTKPLSPTHQADLVGQAGFAQQAGNAGKLGTKEQPQQSKTESQNPVAQFGEADRVGKGGSNLAPSARKPGNEKFLTYIDPKSALKVGFAFNLAIFAIWVVAMVFLWIVLNVVGVWSRLNSLAGDLADGQFSAGLYFGTVFGLGLFELVVFTLLAPIAALVFNQAASFFKGLRISVYEQAQPNSDAAEV